MRGISSMATRHVLGALAAAYTERTGVQVQVESVGGVDAAQRVANGEVFDWVALGEGAMQGLMEQGYLVAKSLVPVVASPTAVAVAEDTAVPSIETEDALRATVREAATLGYSTGPSGKALAALFERWGLTQEVATKLVVPPPGVPVAQWVAQGRIALGFQQRSELLGVPGGAGGGRFTRCGGHYHHFFGGHGQHQQPTRGGAGVAAIFNPAHARRFVATTRHAPR